MEQMDEEKWKAVVGCDPASDGKFFYGVKTTGIFCRPSCKSKNPRREHVIFFDTAEEASAGGLRPCKRCRPDLLEFQPQKELAYKIKKVYDKFYADRKQLEEEIYKAGITRNRLIRLFHEQFGITPVDYVNTLRIERAKELLSGTQDNILDIALQCGFGSISTFYEMFKRIVSVPPKKYRETFNGMRMKISNRV